MFELRDSKPDWGGFSKSNLRFKLWLKKCISHQMNQFKHQMNQFKHQHSAHQQNFPHKLQQRRVYHGHFNTEATFATFKVYTHDTALLLPISINFTMCLKVHHDRQWEMGLLSAFWWADPLLIHPPPFSEIPDWECWWKPRLFFGHPLESYCNARTASQLDHEPW